MLSHFEMEVTSSEEIEAKHERTEVLFRCYFGKLLYDVLATFFKDNIPLGPFSAFYPDRLTVCLSRPREYLSE